MIDETTMRWKLYGLRPDRRMIGYALTAEEAIETARKLTKSRQYSGAEVWAESGAAEWLLFERDGRTELPHFWKCEEGHVNPDALHICATCGAVPFVKIPSAR